MEEVKETVEETKPPKEVEEFQALCKPINDWLQEKKHPYVVIIIRNNFAELYDGIMGAPYKAVD